MKEVLGLLAVILTFVGYVPYLRDTIRGKTHPHVYSWVLYTLMSLLIFTIQIRNGAGAGAYITLAAGVLCFVVFVCGLRYGEMDISRFDTLILVVALIAAGFWMVARQPIISMALATSVDLLAFAPTVRKSWHKPHTETLSLYSITIFRYVLALCALSSFTFMTALYPITWLVINALFAATLKIRRRQIGRRKRSMAGFNGQQLPLG